MQCPGLVVHLKLQTFSSYCLDVRLASTWFCFQKTNFIKINKIIQNSEIIPTHSSSRDRSRLSLTPKKIRNFCNRKENVKKIEIKSKKN